MINEPLPPEYTEPKVETVKLKRVRTKRPSKSKTLWVNGITLTIAVLALAAGDPLFAEYARYIVLVQAVLNLALRVVTDQPIELPKR